MTTINNLSSVDTLASGDQFPIYDTSSGDARKVSASALLAFIRSNFAQPGLERQTAAPTSSGFTVTVAPSTEDQIWLVISPTGTFASGTVELPDNADTFDGQSVLVTSSQAITSLTLDSTGGVNGAPTGLGASGFFEVKYNASAGEWFCVAQSLGAINTFTDPVIIGSLKSSDSETMLAFSQAGGGTAVNYASVTYSISGTKVTYGVDGADTNITLQLGPKGSGDLRLEADTGGVTIGGASVAVFATTSNINLTADAGDVVLAATAGVIDVQNRMEFATAPRLTMTTVGGLPVAPLSGMIAVVTDATATTQNSIVAGGAANFVVVFYDGTNWRIA